MTYPTLKKIKPKIKKKLPYGRRMIESLMIIGGLTIELPSFDMHDVVCARKGIGVD